MYEMVVVGVSAGGMKALWTFFQTLDADFTLPVVVVQHSASFTSDFLARYLNDSGVKADYILDMEEIGLLLNKL